MADDLTPRFDEAGLSNSLDRVELRMVEIQRSAAAFGRTLSGAFAAGVNSSRSFDDVLKSLTIRLSDIALKLAFKPIENALAGSFANLFGGGGSQNLFLAAQGAIKPFASGGVIGTPTYFPMRQGGIGLAGEAGPEAILPLSRGPDGRLGISAQGGGAAITVNIATPDAQSFRRSEVYVTGQIARAVARGQRGM
jgi:phage-related minor tail protein